MLQIIHLSPAAATKLYSEVLAADFPPAELRPVEWVAKMFERGQYFGYQFYKGDAPVGYAFLCRAVDREIYLVDYFAVSSQHRGHGFGSAMLEALRAEFAAAESLLFEVDHPDFADSPAERTKRDRRLAFYHRGGLIDTGVQTCVWGCEFLILALDCRSTFREQAAADRLNEIYQILFPAEFYATKVVFHPPYLPNNATERSISMPQLAHPEFFRTYRSNTVAGTCNNSTLHFDAETTITGKLYYKIRRYGKWNYRFFFSNIADSTFGDGKASWANLCGSPYEILEAHVGDGGAEIAPNAPESLVALTFDGKTARTVGKGETFWSDEAELTIPEGHYLVFTWTVRGTHMPFTPDKIIPSFVKNADGVFVEGKDFPQPQLVGCDAPFEHALAFWGDSITQGLGTTPHKYASWAAKIGHAQPETMAVWNIGLGFARAKDAATKQIWFEKAAVNDTVVLCFGVNDIFHEAASVDSVCGDLETIIDGLNARGVRVILFTVPAFDWSGKLKTLWDGVNERIRTELSAKVFGVFDMAAASSRTDIPGLSRYGAHPNDEGGTAIAEAFLLEFPKL